MNWIPVAGGQIALVGRLGAVIVSGVSGTPVTEVTAKFVEEALSPQVFLAITEIFPPLEDALTVIVLVPDPSVIFHPSG